MNIPFEVTRIARHLNDGKFPAIYGYHRLRCQQVSIPPLWNQKLLKIQKSLIDETLNQLLEVFRQSKGWTKKYSYKWLKLRLKEGTCHGQCLVFIQLVRQTDDIFKAIFLLKDERKAVQELQLEEILRAAMQRENPYETPIAIESDVPSVHEFLEAISDSACVLIRLCHKKRQKGHSIVFGPQNNMGWFFDSRRAGLYSFPSAEQALEALYFHLRCCLPWALKEGGSWNIMQVASNPNSE